MRIPLLLFALALVSLTSGCKKTQEKSRKDEMFSESTGDLAKATVTKYAYEAYPSWAAAHPDKSCPDRLEDLDEYMNNKDANDPWGGRYKMLCGPSLPAGAKGLAVSSPGPDGKDGTPDDVRSW